MALNTTPAHPDQDSYLTVAEADALLANRTDVSDWTSLTNEQKEAALKTATRHIDSLRFFGEPLIDDAEYYRTFQALEFPREDCETQSGQVQSADSTSITDAAIANRSNMPTGFWVGGAVVITDGTGRGQTLKISAFDATAGKITIEGNWTTAPDSTSRYLLIERIPQRVKNATVEQALYLVKGGGERAKMQAEGVTAYKIGDLSETFGGNNQRAGSVPISLEARGYLKGLISRIGVLK